MTLEELEIVISANNQKFNTQIAKVQSKVDSMANHVNRKVDSMANRVNSNLNKAIEDTTATLDNVNARIEQQKNKLAQLKESYRNTFNEAKKSAIEEKILKTEANIIKLTAQSDKLGFKLADLDDKMASLGRDTDNTNTLLNDSNSAANKASKGVNNLSNSSKKANNVLRSYGSAIGMMVRKMLVWNTMFRAISRGLSSMATGLLNNLMTNQQFSNSLAQIRSNLMIAFTPIYEAILPAINTLMSALSVASQYIASFISAIFGKTYEQSKQATQGLIDAKNAMGVYGDSAKEAGEKAKDALGLASFDEINALNSNNNSSGSGGGGANVPQLVTPALDVSNVDAAMKDLVERMKKLLSELLSPLKTAWDNYGDWFLSKWDYFKKAFGYSCDELKNLLVSVWNHGGKEFVQHMAEIGIAIGGTALQIGGDILVALGKLWRHINPNNNPYTRKFINAMNSLAIAVRDFIISAGNWFGKFLNLGGQAFINVIGDIVILIGTILTKVMRDAVKLVTDFMNSWAGSVIIGTVALTLNIVAGAIKAVLVIIEKCHVVLEAFLVLWGAWKFSNIISNIGGLTSKLTGLGSSLANNVIELGRWVGTIGGKAFSTIKNFATYIGGTVVKNLKNFGKEAKNPITTFKNLTQAIKLNVKALKDQIKQLILSSAEWVKSTAKIIAQKVAYASANASIMASVIATKAAAAAQWLLNVALNACPIVAIITAIGLLVVAIKKIGDKFGWWTSISNALGAVLGWISEKVGGLWNKIKSFFGWDSEPAVNESIDSIGEHAEEAAKTTDDAFGTASSNVNKYLDSIHFNATRLAEEVDEATKVATEKFNMLSQNAQEYLDAIVKNDTERLAEMSSNQSAYNEEIKAMYADLTEAEKNEFMKKYGIIQGINDDMLNYEGLTYDERVARHAAYLSTIEKDNNLSYQEKKAKMDQANADFQSSIDKEVAKYKESIVNKQKALDDLIATHGNTTKQGKKYEAELRKTIAEEHKRIEDITNSSYDTRVTTAESATKEIKKTTEKSVKAQKDSYKDLSNTADKAMNDVNNSLKKSEKNIKDFVKISKELSNSLKRSFDSIKSNIDRVMDLSYNKVSSQLNNIRRLFDNFNATLKVKVPHFYMYGEFNAEKKQVPKVGVNYFAKGGVVDRATLGVFGESGKEAIVPLENNTEWMDTLKGIMGSAFTQAMQGNTRSSNNGFGDGDLILQIDSSVIGKVALKELRKMQRQGNITVIPM